MFGIVASIAGSLISNIAGSMVSNMIGSLLSSAISQFGMGNIAGALTNSFMQGFGDGLKDVINGSALPKFMKHALNKFVDNFLGANKQQTTSGAEDAVEKNGMAEQCYKNGYSMCKNAAEDAEKKAGKSGKGDNWLVALAGALAEVQGKFLKNALKNMEDMKGLAGKKGKEQDFLTAQSEYQANMQMFNMMANMTATSLKSLGEGLTAIARKQ